MTTILAIKIFLYTTQYIELHLGLDKPIIT